MWLWSDGFSSLFSLWKLENSYFGPFWPKLLYYRCLSPGCRAPNWLMLSCFWRWDLAVSHTAFLLSHNFLPIFFLRRIFENSAVFSTWTIFVVLCITCFLIQGATLPDGCTSLTGDSVFLHTKFNCRSGIFLLFFLRNSLKSSFFKLFRNYLWISSLLSWHLGLQLTWTYWSNRFCTSWDSSFSFRCRCFLMDLICARILKFEFFILPIWKLRDWK